jgi:hypothetical protein
MENPPTPLKKIKRLEIIYLATIGVLILIVVGIPVLVHRWIAMTDHLLSEQEVLETLLIAVLLCLAYALSRKYNKLILAHRDEIHRLALNNNGLKGRLTDAFKYIGQVNVQVQEIRSAFSLLNQLPQTRKDFKKLLRVFARKALTIANTDWVTVRIINRPSMRTVIEHLETRNGDAVLIPHIGNKSVIEGEPISGRVVVRCENKNLNITVACIFPRDALSWEEKILLEALAGEIELLFLTFTAIHLLEADRAMEALPEIGQSLGEKGLSRELRNQNGHTTRRLHGSIEKAIRIHHGSSRSMGDPQDRPPG